jgi:hypothetical protein
MEDVVVQHLGRIRRRHSLDFMSGLMEYDPANGPDFGIDANVGHAILMGWNANKLRFSHFRGNGKFVYFLSGSGFIIHSRHSAGMQAEGATHGRHHSAR